MVLATIHNIFKGKIMYFLNYQQFYLQYFSQLKTEERRKWKKKYPKKPHSTRPAFKHKRQFWSGSTDNESAFILINLERTDKEEVLN